MDLSVKETEACERERTVKIPRGAPGRSRGGKEQKRKQKKNKYVKLNKKGAIMEQGGRGGGEKRGYTRVGGRRAR